MTIDNTISLDLPPELTQRLKKERVSESELQTLLIAVLETWLDKRAREASPERFHDSAVPFARNLIEQNRTLFEELAQR